MKQVVTAHIAHNRELIPGIHQMELTLPEGFEQGHAGQFVNVYLNDGVHLLPRPISICRWEGSRLTLVYRAGGAGTKLMAAMKAGETLGVSSPIGNGYTLPESGHVLLVGGGVGVPPLFETAVEAKAKGLKVTVAVGYRDALFLKEEFDSAADEVLIATEDGSFGFKGNIVQLLETKQLPEDTVILSCGPKPMLRALRDFAAKRNMKLFVSLEERMGCGFGACVGCIAKLNIGGEVVQKRVCKDGPVFDGSEVIFE